LSLEGAHTVAPCQRSKIRGPRWHGTVRTTKLLLLTLGLLLVLARLVVRVVLEIRGGEADACERM
jgi:hypothetical protein